MNWFPLLTAWGYHSVEPAKWDDESHEEWINDRLDPNRLLKIAVNVFDDDGKLRIFTPDEWEDNWVTCEIFPPQQEIGDDDLPF